MGRPLRMVPKGNQSADRPVHEKVQQSETAIGCSTWREEERLLPLADHPGAADQGLANGARATGQLPGASCLRSRPAEITWRDGSLFQFWGVRPVKMRPDASHVPAESSGSGCNGWALAVPFLKDSK